MARQRDGHALWFGLGREPDQGPLHGGSGVPISADQCNWWPLSVVLKDSILTEETFGAVPLQVSEFLRDGGVLQWSVAAIGRHLKEQIQQSGQFKEDCESDNTVSTSGGTGVNEYTVLAVCSFHAQSTHTPVMVAQQTTINNSTNMHVCALAACSLHVGVVQCPLTGSV